MLPTLRSWAAVLALALALSSCGRKEGAEPGVPATPEAALEGLKVTKLYYNGAARDWIAKEHPELLDPEDWGKISPRGGSLAQAAQEPRLFRRLDREAHFDAVLLVGDPTQFRPLLDHLLDTGDWKLRFLDHTSVVFQREAPEPWTPARLAEQRARAAKLADKPRARLLADLAVKLVAVREREQAKQIIAEAEKADDEVPEVWAAQASYRMALGDWKAAIASADKALTLDKACLPALGCKAQSLYATKRFGDAFAVSSTLLAKMPEEPGILFFHAKIAHEARKFGEEVAALEKLIAIAEKAGRSASGYRVYLGQAHVADANPDPALAEFGRALTDPDLPPEQRKFAEECLAQIDAKLRLKETRRPAADRPRAGGAPAPGAPPATPGAPR